MKIKLTLFIISLTFVNYSFSQEWIDKIKKEKLKKIYSNPTIFYLDSIDIKTEGEVIKLLNNFWTINSFEHKKEVNIFNNYELNRCYLTTMTKKTTVYGVNRKIYENFIGIYVRQNNKGIETVEEFRLDHFRYLPIDILLVLGIKGLHAQLMENKVQGDKNNNYTKKIIEKTKGKTLYISSEDLKEGLDSVEIKKIFKGNFKIVTDSTLFTLISSTDKNIYLALTSRPLKDMNEFKKQQKIDGMSFGRVSYIFFPSTGDLAALSSNFVANPTEYTLKNIHGFGKKDFKTLNGILKK